MPDRDVSRQHDTTLNSSKTLKGNKNPQKMLLKVLTYGTLTGLLSLVICGCGNAAEINKIVENRNNYINYLEKANHGLLQALKENNAKVEYYTQEVIKDKKIEENSRVAEIVRGELKGVVVDDYLAKKFDDLTIDKLTGQQLPKPAISIDDKFEGEVRALEHAIVPIDPGKMGINIEELDNASSKNSLYTEAEIHDKFGN